MSSRPSEWEDLNAYVDGELEPAHAADVAERIAGDPALARQAAALTGMKAALADTSAAPAFDFAPPVPASRRHRRWLAVAASAVFILAASAFWATQFDQTAPAWLSAAATAHDSLVAQQTDAPLYAEQVAAVAGFHPYIPDLVAAKLSLAAAAPFIINGAPDGLALQYTGTRGCQVTYVAFPGEGFTLDESLAQIETGDLTGYGWRVGAIGYAILAHGMDPDRLAVIAANIHAASRLHRPFDDAARTQLAQSRAESRACTD
jgi:anti-sigma factor RsiW